MLLRSDSEGVLAIGQAAHARLSGQLAQAWGNARFGTLEPPDEVRLAAEQHDVGMAAWDLVPTRNPDTGLPHSFTEMPLATHLELWRAGPPRLLTQSRYAALLVSIHGHRLYEQRALARLGPAEADAVQAFLRDGRSFQQRLAESLHADPLTAGSATPELVARNSDLLWSWDFLSLALCLDWAPCTARAVPAAEGAVDLALARGGQPFAVLVDPWPFAREGGVRVRCEGRRLSRRYTTDSGLTRALAQARWETLEFWLLPGGGPTR